MKETVDGLHSGFISLYIHIPFCVRKCRYCDFLSAPSDGECREKYVRALIAEIRFQGARYAGKTADTIFFGGGTPSVLTAEQMERIMRAVRNSFQIKPSAEVSMEVNPGTSDREKLQRIREIGINRISLGVQSFLDSELHLLGRIHTPEQARKAFEDARAAGFANINLDLMSALPGQTLPEFQKSLAEACRLGPEHLSVYSLIIEPGTPFYKMYKNGTLPELPPDEEDRAMYHFTGQYLVEQGYRRYEISNYARPGFECRHNSGYWTGHEYLGLGLGASSLIENTRFHNTDDLPEYFAAAEAAEEKVRTGNTAESSGKSGKERDPEKRKNVHKNVDEGCTKFIGQRDSHPLFAREVADLSEKDRMEEFMFLGLRMMQGVREKEFEERFGRQIDEVYGPVIRRHTEIGTLIRKDGRIFLSERGIDVSNSVMADFLLAESP